MIPPAWTWQEGSIASVRPDHLALETVPTKAASSGTGRCGPWGRTDAPFALARWGPAGLGFRSLLMPNVSTVLAEIQAQVAEATGKFCCGHWSCDGEIFWECWKLFSISVWLEYTSLRTSTAVNHVPFGGVSLDLECRWINGVRRKGLSVSPSLEDLAAGA